MNLPSVEWRKAIQGLEVKLATVPFLTRGTLGLWARIPQAMSRNWVDPRSGSRKNVSPTTTTFILQLIGDSLGSIATTVLIMLRLWGTCLFTESVFICKIMGLIGKPEYLLFKTQLIRISQKSFWRNLSAFQFIFCFAKYVECRRVTESCPKITVYTLISNHFHYFPRLPHSLPIVYTHQRVHWF